MVGAAEAAKEPFAHSLIYSLTPFPRPLLPSTTISLLPFLLRTRLYTTSTRRITLRRRASEFHRVDLSFGSFSSRRLPIYPHSISRDFTKVFCRQTFSHIATFRTSWRSSNEIPKEEPAFWSCRIVTGHARIYETPINVLVVLVFEEKIK